MPLPVLRAHTPGDAPRTPASGPRSEFRLFRGCKNRAAGVVNLDWLTGLTAGSQPSGFCRQTAAHARRRITLEAVVGVLVLELGAGVDEAILWLRVEVAPFVLAVERITEVVAAQAAVAAEAPEQLPAARRAGVADHEDPTRDGVGREGRVEVIENPEQRQQNGKEKGRRLADVRVEPCPLEVVEEDDPAQVAVNHAARVRRVAGDWARVFDDAVRVGAEH